MTRARLQLHLSTLLIVSLLAAAVVWLNVREYDTGISTDVGFVVDSGLRLTSRLQGQGWPWSYHISMCHLRTGGTH
jgi:hypothetical protein